MKTFFSVLIVSVSSMLFLSCGKSAKTEQIYPEESNFSAKITDVKSALEMIARHPDQPSIFDKPSFQRSYQYLLSKYREGYKKLALEDLDNMEETIDLYNAISRQKIYGWAGDSVVISEGIAYVTAKPTPTLIEDWKEHYSTICSDRCRRQRTDSLSYPNNMLTEDPCLVYLVLNSESLSAKDKQEWFTLYARMNEEQVYQLYQTLYGEKYGFGELSAQQFNGEAYEYARKGDFYNAKKAIDKAHSLCPNKADYYDSEGEICLMQGRTERALSLWNKVIELVPDYLKKHNGSTPFYLQLKEQGLLGQ